MSPSTALRRSQLTMAIAAATVAAALLGSTAPARAAGGLKISPSRIDVAAQRGDRLPPITLTNDTNRPLVLTLGHASVGQDLTGLPLPDPAGRAFLRITPTTVQLGAHARRVIRATVTGGPTRGIGAYGVIVATTEPNRRAGSAVIANRLRLSGTVLLRFPGRAAVRGRATALRVTQGAPRVLKAFARVHNSGNIHTKPQARLSVRDATGKVVHAAQIPTGNVIPDADRELVSEIRRILPAGRYTARVAVRLGHVRSSRSTPFTLVGPNQLPTSKLRIVGLTTPRPQAGDPVKATVTVRNTGTAAITPTGLATLAPAGGGATTASTPVSVGTLKPGATTERRLTLPAIRSGHHELKVRFLDGDRVIAERTATFTLATSRSLTARIMDWIAAHLPIVLGALALFIVLFAAAVLARLRQLKRRLLTETTAGRDIAPQMSNGDGHGSAPTPPAPIELTPHQPGGHEPEAIPTPPNAAVATDARRDASAAPPQPAHPPTSPAAPEREAAGYPADARSEERDVAEPAPTAEPGEWQAGMSPPPVPHSQPLVGRRRSGGLVGKLRKPR